MNQDPTSVLVLKAILYQATNGLALILMNVQVILEVLPADNLIIVSTLVEVCKGAFFIFDQSNYATYFGLPFLRPEFSAYYLCGAKPL